MLVFHSDILIFAVEVTFKVQYVNGIVHTLIVREIKALGLKKNYSLK